MSLKKLSDFVIDEIESNKHGKKPDIRTIKKLPWVFKVESGGWWVNMDAYRADLKKNKATNDLINELMKDPEVARLF